MFINLLEGTHMLCFYTNFSTAPCLDPFLFPLNHPLRVYFHIYLS